MEVRNQTSLSQLHQFTIGGHLWTPGEQHVIPGADENWAFPASLAVPVGLQHADLFMYKPNETKHQG